MATDWSPLVFDLKSVTIQNVFIGEIEIGFISVEFLYDLAM